MNPITDEDEYGPIGRQYNQGIPEEEFKKDLEYIENHPLFAKNIPEDKIEGNPELTALQNILYSDTPENLAVYFNNKGNEYMKRVHESKHFQNEAFKCYSEGIDAGSSDAQVNAKLHSNRAAIHIKLRNYGRAIEDCLQAIKLNPSFIKPYFRAAQSYYTVSKYPECLIKCEEGLKLDPKCEELIEIKKKAQEQLAKAAKEKVKRYESLSELTAICKEKGITLGKNIFQVPDVDMRLHADGDKNLFVPILLCYPEFSQIDIIRAAPESDPFEIHIAEIFQNGLPWDQKDQYIYGRIEAYIELNQVEPYMDISKPKKSKGKLKKINMELPIADILRTKNYVLPQIMEVQIVAPASSFYEHFKKTNEFV